MPATEYKGFEITTAQDGLGRWHATIHDPKEDTTLATVPKDENYGTKQQQQAVYAARGLIDGILNIGY